MVSIKKIAFKGAKYLLYLVLAYQFILASTMIYAWVFNIDDPDVFQYIHNFKKGKKSPYPSITPVQYVKLLAQSPKDVLIFDTRNYGVLGRLKKVTLANSISNKLGKEGLFDYFVKNQNKFKNKKVVFICHGGHHAQNLQKEFGDLLIKNNISNKHYALNPGYMFQYSTFEFPPWIVQKIIFLPKSLIKIWRDDNLIETFKIKNESNKNIEFWSSVKNKILSIPGPVVIEGEITPSQIEKNIYPLENERYYIWDNFLSPPFWLAKAIYKSSKVIPYQHLKILLFLGAILLLTYFRWQEILKKEKANKLKIIRISTGLLLLIFSHYFAQCFFQNHKLIPDVDISFSPSYFLIMIALVWARISYNENKTRDLLNLKLKTPHTNFRFWEVLDYKRFLILVLPCTYMTFFFIAQQWEPYKLWNMVTFSFALMLIFYTPIVDFIFSMYISFKRMRLINKNLGLPN